MGLTKIIASILLLMAFVVAAQAQVTVTLVDGEGKPVAEATVEANKKVIGKTDADGTATLDASYLNQQLCFTHVGFQLFCEKVTNNVNKFTLKSNDNFLDAAVVTSYENTTRRNTVGNVSSIDMSRIPVRNNSNALAALQGLAPGLDVRISGGGLGQASKVRVQGDQSLLFAAPPIYVVDGVVISEYQTNSIARSNMGVGSIMPSVENQSARGNYIDFLNFNNIESITILKDADAVAIYGSRGANGAIVIITKKSISNSLTVRYNANLSWQPRRLDLMNTEEYLKMRRIAIGNSGINNPVGEEFYDLQLFDTSEYNNWQEIVMGHKIFNYSLDFSLATVGKGSSNRISFSYNPNKHFYDKNSRHNQFFISNVLDKELFDGKVRITNSSNIAFVSSNQNAIDLTAFSVFTPPNFPKEVFDSEKVAWVYKNELLFSNKEQHPLERKQDDYRYNNMNFLNSINIKYQANDFLYYDFIYGLSYTNSDDRYIRRISEEGLSQYPGFVGEYSLKNFYSWVHNVESFLTLNSVNLFDKIKITNVIGVNYSSHNNEAFSYTFQGNPIEEYSTNINYYTKGIYRNQDKVYYKYFAFYNRLITKYNNFLININYRYDGSSRFSPENRWASFYSFGIGWNLSNEKWFNNPDIFIKPRVSYGKLGNDNIPDYGYLQTFTYAPSMNYPNGSIVRELNLYSKNYKWENLRKANIGIDFKYNKFSLLFDYSITKSKDQLINDPLPQYLGQSSIFRNFPGVFRIESMEFNLSYLFDLSGSKTFSVQAMLTLPKNKLIKFPGLENSSYVNTFVVGKSKSIVGAEIFGGVDPDNGLYYYYDNDNKVTYIKSQAKRELIETPVFYYGSVLLGFNSTKFKISANLYLLNEKRYIRQVNDYSVTRTAPGNRFNNYRFLLYNNYDANRNTLLYQKFITNSTVMPSGKTDNLKFYYFRLNNLSATYTFDRLLKGKNVDITGYLGNILLGTNAKELNYETNNNEYLPVLMNAGINVVVNL